MSDFSNTLLLATFFGGSAKAAAASLLDSNSASRLSDGDLKELEALIRKARKERK